MPPAVVPLLLIALGIPAALRAVTGRPRALGASWLAAAAACAVAQVVGELAGIRTGILGDAQLLLAALASALAAVAVSLLERRER